MEKSESGQRYLCPYCQVLLQPGQIHDCTKDKQIADLQTKLDECELALDDMRLGRAIADNKLDIARESFHLILDGKPGVNLSNDYLRGWDIGIAEETLRKLGG